MERLPTWRQVEKEKGDDDEYYLTGLDPQDLMHAAHSAASTLCFSFSLSPPLTGIMGMARTDRGGHGSQEPAEKQGFPSCS